MNKIRDYFRKNKVTVMIIPKSQKSIRQWHFNLAIAFSILILLIILNIALLTTTVSSKFQSSKITYENQFLSENLNMQEDKISALENINSLRAEEIKVLKTSLEDTLDYVDTRLREMNAVQENVAELVTMFNRETSSSIAIPVSRSFDRYLNKSSESLIPMDDALLGQVENLVTDDELSQIIKDQEDQYTQLIEDIQSQMTYLECRPDLYPAEGILTSQFGYRKDPVTKQTAKHNGIDIANVSGTRVRSAGNGIVIFAGWNGSFGNVIIIDHGYGYKTVYAHLKEINITKGDTVSKGALIGHMGSSGKSTGTHLHFEVRFNDSQVNPLNILKK